MTQHKRHPQEDEDEGHRGEPANDGLPNWISAVVVLVLIALLAYNVVIVGPDGYPTSVIIGGLLGAYAGFDQLLRKRGGDDK